MLPNQIFLSKAKSSAVRISAKELTSLILDEDRLRSERSDRKLWKTRVTGIDEYAPQAIAGPAQPNPRQQRRNTRQDEEDAEMRLAIEASKHEADEDARRRAKDKSSAGDNDDDLAKAIKLSKEEESLRARQLEDQNAASLFDDTPTASQPQPTGFNQGYQQQPAVDWFGNPLQQQPQQTGFLNNQYAQPQQTGYQNGYTNGFGQQPTGYDQFGQQPFLQQQNTIQPQQTAFQTNNPYGMQQQPQPSIFDAQPQQQQQQESSVQPGSHNPWATGNQQQQPLQPLPTGSNNPFAQRQQQQSQPPMPQRTQTQPTLSTLYEQQPATQFKPQQPNPIASFQPPPPQQQQQRPQDQQYAKLNALLASGEGQDTFGNVGDLRIPAQHTAPGTFVNSAGAGAQRLTANATGSNPFFSQQFTGAPQLPAQTGLAGGFGGYGQQQSNNPFGGQQRQQGGSLIDL